VPELASFPFVIGHKMLCPNVDKIMPVAGACQGFAGNFSLPNLKLKTVTYKLFRSKCFKNLRKNMALL
jgi:hypothetical protein